MQKNALAVLDRVPECLILAATNPTDARLVGISQEVRGVRESVLELIDACHERDEAQNQYDLADGFYGEDSNHKEMREARGRIRKAVKRYVAALAAFS